jgi:hypothetical protein
VAWLAAVALVILGAGAGTPFRSDGGKFWAPKARELAFVGASEAPSLHDPERLGLHRDYPLLVPALLAPAFTLSPPDAAAGPKLLLTALTLALLGVTAALLLRCGTRGLALLAVFATLPLLVSLDARESAVAAGFADSADALFLLLFVVAVDRLREAQGPAPAGGVVLASLAGAGLASTKLEGSVEAACVLAAASIAGPRRGALLAAGAGALLLALPSFVLRAGVAPDVAGFELARLADVEVLQARLVPVLAGLGGLLLDASSFGLLPLLLLWWVVRSWTVRPPPGADLQAAGPRRVFATLLFALTAAFVLASYTSTSMHAGRHIDTSAHRLLWHWLPVATWLVARHDARESRAAPALRPEARA